MRPFLVLSVLILAACAQPGGKYGYSGNRMPASSIDIQPDGSFVARSAIGRDEDTHLARQSAIARVRLAAADGGYSNVLLEAMKIVELPDMHLMLTGRLYPMGEGPAEAGPVEAMGAGVLAVADAGLVEQRKPVRLPGGAESTKPLHIAYDDRQTDPIVIAAPVFVEE